ncbi:MAG TPA: DUF4139 domain-containing protein [Bacteroidia bacterium]|jgi:uncharacterized protein (TIGR02231 family)|nr:DUF4139 domain-containing protein [Bacteroidia bacterium]
MKNQFKITCLFIALSFFNFLTFAAEKPQEIKMPVSAVKVFLNSALITHIQKVKLKQGLNKLAFSGLAMNINGKNISLRNLGKSELLSLTLVTLNDTTNILSLQEDLLYMIRKSKDSILTLEKNIEKLKFEIEGLELEKRMLVNNDNIIPNSKTISLAELKITTEYYRDRYKDVSIEIANKQRDLKQLKRNKVRALKNAFDVDNDEEKNMTISIIIAELNNPEGEATADLELSYLAKESGWIPVYEVLSSNNKNLKINYRSKILNNTGIDWNNMNITLSTADPFQYYAAPDLEPYYVDGGNRYEDNSNNKVQQKKTQNYVEEEEIFTPDREITFTIAKKYNFKSGLIPFLVDITVYDLSPEYLYRCAPKKEEQVYSIARIKDWEKLNLIDGEASIYNNGSFLGKMYIKPSEIEDYLELPLGVMDNIFVKHKLLSELSSKKFFAGGTVGTFDYEIKIKNISTEKVVVEVIDQVPVSESSSVKTDVIEMTEGGDKDVLTGKIIWKVELNTSTEKILSLKYAISYPRGYRRSSSFYRSRKVRAKF